MPMRRVEKNKTKENTLSHLSFEENKNNKIIVTVRE